MIRINTVTKKYPDSLEEIALDRISTVFETGKIHGIIGTSGAGKSTLIRLLNKLETYDDGTIEIFEYKDLKALNKESTRMLRTEIGMIFQTDHLLLRKTVLENVLLPITFHRKVTANDIVYAKKLLSEVGLKEYTERYPSQLSGGQRQRVGIARALINNPKLLLCDEPTSALDVITTGQILNLIKEVAQSHNVDVMIVTHDMNVVKEICDTVTIMEKGKIVESGNLDTILFKAKHTQTKAFIKNTGFDITSITNTFCPNELLLLKFNKEIVQEPIISQMINQLKIDVSIIYANVMPHNTGVMVLHIPRGKTQVKIYLEERRVVVDNVV